MESDNPSQRDLPEGVYLKYPSVLNDYQKGKIKEVYPCTKIGEFMENDKTSCDIDILVESEVFKAHRAALGPASSYFSDLFSKSGYETLPFTIRMKNCSAAAFKVILDFIYSGNINVNSDILADIVALADFLDIAAIKNGCFRYLKEMPLEQVIKSIKGKQLSASSDVFKSVLLRISEEFSGVSRNLSFLELDVGTLCLILSHDDLRITSEMDVFRAALKWLLYKKNKRQRDVNSVLKCVRFQHMERRELVICLEATERFPESHEIRDTIVQAHWVVTVRQMKRKDPLNSPVVRRRSCFSSKTLFKSSSVYSRTRVLPEAAAQLEYMNDQIFRTRDILAIGGFDQYIKASDSREMRKVERYNTTKNQWVHYTDLPKPNNYCIYSAGLLNNKVYLVGGSGPKEYGNISDAVNDVFVLNLADGSWILIEPMNTPRMHHGVVALYGMLYAVGGEDENGRVLNTIECYNPMTKQWSYENPMSIARLGAGVAAFEGKIVVAGGFGEPSMRNSDIPVLSSVEIFDPSSNSWTQGNGLRFPRCHGNLVNVQEKLYLCGGATQSSTTDDSVLTSVSAVDVYNKEEGVWEHKSDLNIARYFAGSALIGGKIVIMGGMSTVANKTLSSVECYDTVNDVWINGIQDLPHPAQCLSCVTLPRIYCEDLLQ